MDVVVEHVVPVDVTSVRVVVSHAVSVSVSVSHSVEVDVTTVTLVVSHSVDVEE